MLKRGFDLLASVLGIVVLSPLLGLTALAILVTSGRPVLYRGVRVGLGGVRFRIFKFRTMVADAERRGGTTTGDNDPRVTALGRFLRSAKLDELPQLFNVVLGQMSLVGPRPEVPEYADAYTGDECLILSVRPGITDLSSLEFIDLQSRVGADDPDRVFREQVLPVKNRLRVQYVRTRSFGGDLVILARTVLRVMARAFSGGRGGTRTAGQ